MNHFEQSLTAVNANVTVEQTSLSLEAMKIIKKAIELANTTKKSFLTCLYELLESEKEERKTNHIR